MSSVGSVLSTSSTSLGTQSVLQECLYLKERLSLSEYTAGRGPTPQYYARISSKTLRESYVLPDDGTAVEDVLARLGEVARRVKAKNTKPPHTDFTCLSRQRKTKVCLDIDCVKCKNGGRPSGRRHFTSSGLLSTLVSAVGEVFGVTCSRGVYLTNGGDSCGYHVFFNTLAYGLNGVTETTLMDAIDAAFKRAGLSHAVAVDRGCTQLPLPMSVHANSNNYPTPYVLRTAGKWEKSRLRWLEMDADTLKCFSNIAFPDRYKTEAFGTVSSSSSPSPSPPPPPSTLPAPSPEPPVTTAEANDFVSIDVAGVNGGLRPPSPRPSASVRADAREVTAVKRKIRSSTPPPPQTTDWANAASAPKRKCLSQVAFCATASDHLSAAKGFVDTRDRRASAEGDRTDSRDRRVTKKRRRSVGAAEVRPFDVVAPSATDEPPVVSTVDGSHEPNARPTPADTQTTPREASEDDDDAGSTVSTYSEFGGAASFVCSGVAASRHVGSDVVAEDEDAVHMPPPLPTKKYDDRSKRTGRTTTKRQHEGINNVPSIDTIERLPYTCEDDRTSGFADKQYKAALLYAEEKEAEKSRARLTQEENRNVGESSRRRRRRRVYVVPGSSADVAREYKLLVQLVNVNRRVYGNDLATRREWTDLQVSYYDQHLRNPVLLVIFKFVFGERRVAALFDRDEHDGVVRSIVHLMTPYRVRRREDESTSADHDDVDDDDDEERSESGARAHKARLVGALIRVCTHKFDMVTAVVSDLRKVQQAKERKDLTLLNRTVVGQLSDGARAVAADRERVVPTTTTYEDDADDADWGASDEDLDCSASMRGDDGGRGGGGTAFPRTTRVPRCTTNHTLLASLVVHEHDNLNDQSLYAYLYYYHSFPSGAVDRILDEVHHDGLMVSALIKYYHMYDHRGKALTLQEIFEGFNDAAIALSGPEYFVKLKRRKSQRRRGAAEARGGSVVARNQKKRTGGARTTTRGDEGSGGEGTSSAPGAAAATATSSSGGGGDDAVARDEIEKLMAGAERKRRRAMCCYKTNGGGGAGGTPSRDTYEWKDKHVWQAVINYCLRPVAMHEDRLVFANDSYDTFEDDAVESCAAHLTTRRKTAKADVVTAFKDARTVWRMHHGSQLVYESDLRSDTLGCYFHINVALKMYEMLCGGCLTRMKRVHKNYLIDRTRFNVSVYDVVAECRTATVRLASAIDRSYVNLLLNQPVAPPFLESDVETRRLFLADAELRRGSFCCLSVMDYVRALNLFERSNCLSKSELDNCQYVETFLNDLYTNETAVRSPPNAAAAAKVHLLYVFYSLYMYEVLFRMRHSYARRENCYVSIERLVYELDVRELLVLFFGESSMKRVDGLEEETERKIRQTAENFGGANKSYGASDGATTTTTTTNTPDGRFDVRPVLSADVPDKVARMKTLFGQFGYDVMQERVDTTAAEIEADAVVAPAVPEPPRSENEAPGYGGGGGGSGDGSSSNASDGEPPHRTWTDECEFEQEFYAGDGWLDAVRERVSDRRVAGKIQKRIPGGSKGSGRGERMFLRETVRTIMRLELKRHVDHDRLGRLAEGLGKTKKVTGAEGCRGDVLVALRDLPLRLKLLALVLTTHTVKTRSDRLAAEFIDATYRRADGRYEDERRVYEGEVNAGDAADEDGPSPPPPPEKVWCRAWTALLNDRRSLLLHARWLAERRFERNFFVGLEPEKVYDVLYEYMRDHADLYPSFGRFDANADTRSAAQNLCTAMMYVLVMSAYDQQHVDLYLKTFLAVEWPGQWAKTIFVWKSNSNAGKSYLFDSIIKRACANSTCINDPKGGKENAPEKAEYVKNFVLFANEFSQANSNELKKIVSESTFKFRMNYGNVMNEVYATGKIMFNCNTLPPTSDEAAINRLTLFSVPFWFCRRQRISDAMLNWVRGLSEANRTCWETAYRYELPSLLNEEEKRFFENHRDTKNEADLFDEYATLRPPQSTFQFNAATSSMFLAQNKTSRLYVASSPPTDRIVHGLVNITAHFSWLRHFKGLDNPVDFSTLPTASQAVRSEWLSLTLPYQEWKSLTGARTDPSGRVPAEKVSRSLQAFAAKKNVNYFAIRQFFESDFASSREAIKDEYYMCFDSKAVCE